MDEAALRVQNGAYRTLNANLEQEIAAHRAKAREYDAAIKTLDSEREANAILTATIEAQAHRIADLEERGIKAVIAYHAAICSPKGVVPDDDLYDPFVADTIQRALDAGIPVRFAPPLPDTGLQAKDHPS